MDIVKKAKKKPMSHATTICDSVCWRNIMRLVPTMPEINTTKENHQIGLKVNRKAKDLPPHIDEGANHLYQHRSYKDAAHEMRYMGYAHEVVTHRIAHD